MKPEAGELDLSNVVAVDNGPKLDRAIGGRLLRLKKANGKSKRFIITDRSDLADWTQAVQKAIGGAS
jgi:hypothetical protein